MTGMKCEQHAWFPLGIDRLINAAVSRDALVVLLILGGLVVAPHVSEAALAAIGVEPSSGRIALSLLWAALLIFALRRLRSGDADVLHQARIINAALRRYVPGAVAAQLESGRALEPEERDVSVLFVDIRGFTALSEGRAAAEMFSTVNWYTERVSQLVRRHGGNVVEFNGDGMMAVFGAPQALPHNERAAVEAGHAIVAAMLAVPPSASTPLAVGVGIATGRAFVGNIQAVDRVIWTAIGDPPNLAARLQGVTRDLDAAIAIDGPTWAASGDAVAAFERHHNVPIRGLRHAEDVYALPVSRLCNSAKDGAVVSGETHHDTPAGSTQPASDRRVERVPGTRMSFA